MPSLDSNLVYLGCHNFGFYLSFYRWLAPDHSSSFLRQASHTFYSIMCFSGEASATFAALGLFASWWVYTRTSNIELASGIFFFFTMELLQAVQYFFLADGLASPVCETTMNKILTILGFLHICLQPYYCHVINASLTKSCKYKDRYNVIKRLCLIGGFLLFIRYFLAFIPELNTMDVSDYKSTEWLRGEKLCTFKSKTMWHLGWSVPMADPSYYVMGAGIHSFLMFAPFFALYEKKGMILQGTFLFVFGPLLASMISDNLMEQASIWCFFSIAQVNQMTKICENGNLLMRCILRRYQLCFSSSVRLLSSIGARATFLCSRVRTRRPRMMASAVTLLTVSTARPRLSV